MVLIVLLPCISLPALRPLAQFNMATFSATAAGFVNRIQKHPWRFVGIITLMTLLQFAVTQLMFHLPLREVRIIPLWVPAGLAQTLVLRFGRSLLPGVGLGTLLSQLVHGRTWDVSLAAGVSDMLQVAFAVILLRWSRFNPRLSSLSDVVRLFVFGAILPGNLSASLGAVRLCSMMAVPWAQFGQIWGSWWIGNITGVLTLMPMFLTLGQWRSLAQRYYRFLEAGAWLFLLIASSWFVFFSPYRQQVAPYPLEYLPFPFLIWGALRFGQAGASLAIFVITSLATWGVIQGMGPFFKSSPAQAVQVLQLYICVLALTALVLAAVMTEREDARQQSERLLLKILPSPVADRLKQREQTIADSFAEVTVLFADIVNFTALSANLAPTELVALLNDIFSTFDDLAEKHGLEKIKTIGDAYMVVGGIPYPRADHAPAVAEMALDMQAAIANFKCHHHNQPFDMRIGMNTGPVVAGVIGTKKFLYDLWGDTVNIASRMESQGQRGQIQVTEATYQALKDQFTLAERGTIHVKGRGDMTTYWLLGRK